MEIQALKLLVPEDAVNRLVAEHAPKDVPVQKLVVRLTPEGVRVQGEYPTVFMKVAFDSLVDANGGRGTARSAAGGSEGVGFPRNNAAGRDLQDAQGIRARSDPGLTVDGDTLRINIDQFLAAKGLPLKVNLREVLCRLGSLLIEAGSIS